jgi:uncharacterized protein YheU (UPF0270 family)
MIIPWKELKPETLQALIEEFVSREGTDYGERELTFDTKCAQVRKMLEKREIEVVFDQASESCDLREARSIKKSFEQQAESAPERPAEP